MVEKGVLFVYRVDMPGFKPKYSEEALITVTAKIASSQQEITNNMHVQYAE